MNNFKLKSLTCKDNRCHCHESMQIYSRVEGNVFVEEGFSAHGYQVATHCQEHVGKQK